jgi:hypothetical protein
VLPIAAAPALAAGNGEWSVRPVTVEGSNVPRDFIFLEILPGQAVEEAVVIENETNATKIFDLYAADAFNTPSGGSFALTNPEQEVSDVGTWVTFEDSQKVEVAGGESVTVPVTIQAPKNATPGDHVGGIVAVDTEFTPAPPGQTVAVETKQTVGVRVYARVTGPLTPSLAIENYTVTTDGKPIPFFGSGSTNVSFTVRNTGNVRITATGRVVLTTFFGREIASVPPTELPEILPGQVVALQTTIDDSVFIGPVQARLELTSPETNIAADGTAWVIPWVALIVLAVVLGVLYALRRRTRKEQPLEPTALEEPAVQVGP